jgi:prolyl-tRNA synthetase
MRFSNALIKTDKSKKVKNSFDLVLKAGLVHQFSAGSYGFLPIGQRVLDKIIAICCNELEQQGALKINAPLIQPSSLWMKSGRWDVYGNEMLKMRNREGQQFCAAPTHEEALTDMVANTITSYKDLPFTLFQVGSKYRDELRPRHGLLRTREFLMLDAYSFDLDKEGLVKKYEAIRATFESILKQLGLEFLISQADNGEVGGAFSEEFLAPATYGEDEILVGGKTVKGIEVAHIFQLGTVYSDSMGLNVVMPNGDSNSIIMGCYGIGLSRLIPAIIDQNHDSKGIIWPNSVAPYTINIIPVNEEEPVQALAMKLEEQCQGLGIEVLLDDRKTSSGNKFRDSDLLGIPYNVIIGRNFLETGKIEVENRRTGNKLQIAPEMVLSVYNFT